MRKKLQRFSRHSLPITLWKNGRGSTCEVLSWLPSAGMNAFDCKVLGGPSIDLNVMSRREKGFAELHVIAATDSRALPPAHGGLLMSLAGCWRVADEVLDAGDGCWWADASAPRAWLQAQLLDPDQAASKIVVVRRTPVAPTSEIASMPAILDTSRTTENDR